MRDGLRVCAIAWVCGEVAAMTQTFDDDLLELAVPYALDAVSDRRDELERLHPLRCPSPTRSMTRSGGPRDDGRGVGRRRRGTAGHCAGDSFGCGGSRCARQRADSADGAQLQAGGGITGCCPQRRRSQSARRPWGRRPGASADPPAPRSTAQQVFAAPDVHRLGAIPAGGTATVVFSRDRKRRGAGDERRTAPSPGTVYQMWLVSPKGASSGRNDGRKGWCRRRPPRCSTTSASQRWRSPSNRAAARRSPPAR